MCERAVVLWGSKLSNKPYFTLKLWYREERPFGIHDIIYKVTVTTAPRTTSNYSGMVENDFKTRFNNHKLSFRNQNHSHDTVLSKYICELKNNDTTYDIKWCIIKTANAYKGNPSCCNLCLSEKLCILTAGDTILNKWSELVTKCHQENKFFAANHRKRCSNHPWISNFLNGLFWASLKIFNSTCAVFRLSH